MAEVLVDVPENVKKRKRQGDPLVKQACNFCQRRHLKCDGEQPCFQCRERKRADCSYTVACKRGRKPKNIPASSSKENSPDMSLMQQMPQGSVASPNGADIQAWQKNLEALNRSGDNTPPMESILKSSSSSPHSLEAFMPIGLPSNASAGPGLALPDSMRIPPMAGILSPDGKPTPEDEVPQQMVPFARLTGLPHHCIVGMYVVACMEHLLPLFPEVKLSPIYTSFDWDKWAGLSVNNHKKFDYDLVGLIEAFEYGIVCIHVEASLPYLHHVETIVYVLFVVERAHHNKTYAPRLMDLLMLLSLYYSYFGDKDKQKRCNDIARFMVCKFNNKVKGVSAHRIYRFVAAISIDPKEREMWLRKSEQIPEEEQSVESILSYVGHTLGYLTINKLECISKDHKENQRHILKILQELDLAETKINQMNGHVWDKEMRLFICGSRGICFYQMGLWQQAKYWASQALQFIPQTKYKSIGVAVGVAMAVRLLCREPDCIQWVRIAEQQLRKWYPNFPALRLVQPAFPEPVDESAFDNFNFNAEDLLALLGPLQEPEFTKFGEDLETNETEPIIQSLQFELGFTSSPPTQSTLDQFS